MIEEWAIGYVNPTSTPRMDGTRPERILIVGSRELAEQALGWQHSPWDSYLNRRVIRREVTPWEEVQSVDTI